MIIATLSLVEVEYSPWFNKYIRAAVSRYHLVYLLFSFSKGQHSDFPEYLMFQLNGTSCHDLAVNLRPHLINLMIVINSRLIWLKLLRK